VDAGEVVLKRGRRRKFYHRWKPQLTLDFQRDRAIIEALFERIPKGRRAAFVREALRAYVEAGGVEEFLRVKKDDLA
jgi:hypothetical protein